MSQTNICSELTPWKRYPDAGLYLPSDIRIVQILVFPVMLYRSESLGLKKQIRKNINAFELWYWKSLPKNNVDSQENKCITEQINPLLPFEEQMIRCKFYFRYII